MLSDALYPIHSFDLCCTLLLSKNYPLLQLYGDVAVHPDMPWVSFIDERIYYCFKEIEESFQSPANQATFMYYKNKIITKGLLPLLKKDPLSFNDKDLLFALLDKKP